MAEAAGWQREAGDAAAGRLFYFASELNAGAEALGRRRREKYQVLVSAGIALPAEGWQEGEMAIWLSDGDCDCLPTSYVDGANSGGGMGGSMGGGDGGGGDMGGGVGGVSGVFGGLFGSVISVRRERQQGCS
jgi:hypothetical protein